MEKKQIETFIKKYNLNGAIEGVVWQNNNNHLLVTAMTADRKLYASVQFEDYASKITGFTGVEIPIQETTRLKKMLSFLSDDIALSLDIDPLDATRVRQIIGEDSKNSMIHPVGSKTTIDPIPSMKNIPPFEVEIPVTTELVDSFSKAFSAIGDDQTLFTLVMSKKKNKLEMVFGYRNSNTSNRLAIELLPTTGKDTVKNPISFNAKNLKEILTANAEVTDSVLSISEAGLASIAFNKDGLKSQYYLIKIDVED